MNLAATAMLVIDLQNEYRAGGGLSGRRLRCSPRQRRRADRSGTSSRCARHPCAGLGEAGRAAKRLSPAARRDLPRDSESGSGRQRGRGDLCRSGPLSENRHPQALAERLSRHQACEDSSHALGRREPADHGRADRQLRDARACSMRYIGLSRLAGQGCLRQQTEADAPHRHARHGQPALWRRRDAHARGAEGAAGQPFDGWRCTRPVEFATRWRRSTGFTKRCDAASAAARGSDGAPPSVADGLSTVPGSAAGRLAVAPDGYAVDEDDARCRRRAWRGSSKVAVSIDRLARRRRRGRRNCRPPAARVARCRIHARAGRSCETRPPPG